MAVPGLRKPTSVTGAGVVATLPGWLVGREKGLCVYVCVCGGRRGYKGAEIS